MKLLDEILSDYPRIWNFYKQDSGDKQRQPKYAQRYPLPLGTLSMVLDFHKWVNQSSLEVADKTGIELSNHIKRHQLDQTQLLCTESNGYQIIGRQ